MQQAERHADPLRAAMPERVRLMDVAFDPLTEREVIDQVVASRGGCVCTVNLDVLRQSRIDDRVRSLVESSELVVADGMPLIWASRLQGTPLPERVAGSSLTVTLPAGAAKAGRSVFLLGGNPGAADDTAARLLQTSPDLRVAGTLCPPLGFENDPAELEAIDRAIVAAQPDVVFVGLTFIKTVLLIDRLRPLVPDAWFVSCGVSFSFVSGEVSRAPGPIQRLGLEWLHRLAQEPRRLGHRYLVQGPPFLARLLASAVRTRLRR